MTDEAQECEATWCPVCDSQVKHTTRNPSRFLAHIRKCHRKYRATLPIEKKTHPGASREAESVNSHSKLSWIPKLKLWSKTDTLKYNLKRPKPKNVFTTKVETWKYHTKTMLCPMCNEEIVPIISMKRRKFAISCLSTICLLGCWSLCSIPSMMRNSKNPELRCPICGYNFSRETESKMDSVTKQSPRTLFISKYVETDNGHGEQLERENNGKLEFQNPQQPVETKFHLDSSMTGTEKNICGKKPLEEVNRVYERNSRSIGSGWKQNNRKAENLHSSFSSHSENQKFLTGTSLCCGNCDVCIPMGLSDSSRSTDFSEPIVKYDPDFQKYHIYSLKTPCGLDCYNRPSYTTIDDE